MMYQIEKMKFGAVGNVEVRNGGIGCLLGWIEGQFGYLGEIELIVKLFVVVVV